jgi:chromosome partitioning protein
VDKSRFDPQSGSTTTRKRLLDLMAKIIGIAQVKGGAGRSTIATNLAAILSSKANVVLIDCDMPQGTSMSWYSIREEANKAGKLSLDTVEDHKELVEKVQEYNHTHSYIILDAPPRIAEMTRVMLILSNLLIIPLGTSAAEIWATTDLLATIDEAKKKRANLDYRILWNRYRSYTKSAKELSSAVHEELKAPEFKTKLGYRVAYADALAHGLAVNEWHDKAAKAEMINLAVEITKVLKRGK